MIGPLELVGGDAPSCEDGVCVVPEPVDPEQDGTADQA